MSESGALGPLRSLDGLRVLRRVDQGRVNAAPAQARVYNNANISISHNTLTALTFNSKRFDTGNFHSTSANTSRLTAPTAGLYVIGAGVQWDASSAGIRAAAIRLNGSTQIVNQTVDIDSATNHSHNLSTQYQLAAGDYVELVAFQTSGGALNVLASGNYSPEFWIHRVGSQA